MNDHTNDASRGAPAEACAPLGQLAHIKKVFPTGRGDSITAVEDVSLEFGEGELISLLGPSGCGKTTVLKMIGGLIQRTGGSIRIAGSDVTGPYSSVGMVFQAPTLMPWRTVLDNVLFPMEVLGSRPRKEKIADRDRALELLAMVGLEGFEKARPMQLSGGMQQRVALCRALIHNPTILLMDEPFGALDELTRMDMNDLLLDVRKMTGTTVVFVTHSISEAIYLSDTVYVFSTRPATIALRLPIDIGYPRTSEVRYSERFVELQHRAGEALGITR